MLQKRLLSAIATLAVLMTAASIQASAQVTTSRINAVVLDPTGSPRSEVRVTVLHVPSGTKSVARTRSDGRVSIPGLRVGGPYTVTAASIGFQADAQTNVFLNLGESTDLKFVLRPTVTTLSGITVTGVTDPVFSQSRTGAATAVGRQALATLPTITGRLESIVRLTPQSGGGMSFAGQDPRFNNITVDGSAFNNSFGLASTPGDRTGVAPISLAAIEQVQVNVAPYDVRSGNFVGAEVNTVTRSGTNAFRGSIYHTYKNQNLTGKKAGSLPFDPGVFKFDNTGGWISGPIVPNRLFYFFSYEDETTSQPGTTFRANTGSETSIGNVTRVKASDLDALSTYLQSNFAYATGGYQGYNNATPVKRLLGKMDFNLNDRNKFTLRYTRLDSKADILESNSNSLGNGNRRSRLESLNFQNSNYGMLENIRSIVGEWNSLIGNRLSNSLIIGYTTQNESREPKGQFFPLVDILEGGLTYTSFGFEPFTPNNELYYQTRQIQDNLTISLPKHELTFGASVENYQSQNVFFPGSQSVYVYNSLADFYTDANGYLANPNRTTSPVTLKTFQVRWNNIPGQIKPTQPLKVIYAGIYGQDEWRASPNFHVTAGLRVDVPYFKNTAFNNPLANQLLFRDPGFSGNWNGNLVTYQSGKLPDPKPLFSPRVGFNWDVQGDRSLQFRGGTGVFTGRPAYVWISNQIGQTGVLTGFQQLTNTTARPFNPNPNTYKPATVTGAPASSYELDITDPNFRFPQTWRTDIGIDKKIFWGMTATGEFLFSRDVNGMYYINANLPGAQTRFVGPGDTRPRWTNNKLNSVISGCTCVLKNQNAGRSSNIAFSLEKPFTRGLFLKAAYAYGVARNTIDPGSIALGTWNGNPVSNDPNVPGLSYSANSPGHRFFTAGSLRREYFHFGATTLSAFFEARTIGNSQYTFSADMNGDGANNDLIYIPRDQSEMNFQAYTIAATSTTPAVSFTAAQQAAAWDAFINQDKYLSKHRGEYAQRGAIFLPLVKRLDFGIAQELFANALRHRNTLEFRADIVNFGNLLNKNWGLGQRLVTVQPLTNPSVDASGRSTYRLRAINNELITHSLEQTAGSADTYRVQIGFRYSFN